MFSFNAATVLSTVCLLQQFFELLALDCKNGGTLDRIRNNRCNCLGNTYGEECQFLCNNGRARFGQYRGGSFEEGGDFYGCQCYRGYSGVRCNKINVTAPNAEYPPDNSDPCCGRGTWQQSKNSGTRISNESGTCLCLPGFYGNWCQFSCGNGVPTGTSSARFTCKCNPGYKGIRCDIDAATGQPVAIVNETTASGCTATTALTTSTAESVTITIPLLTTLPEELSTSSAIEAVFNATENITSLNNTAESLRLGETIESDHWSAKKMHLIIATASVLVVCIAATVVIVLAMVHYKRRNPPRGRYARQGEEQIALDNGTYDNIYEVPLTESKKSSLHRPNVRCDYV